MGKIFRVTFLGTNTIPNIRTLCYLASFIFSSDKKDSFFQIRKISVQHMSWEVIIFQNVKDAVETAIMNIIEDVISKNIEEELCRKKPVRLETPNIGTYYWTLLLHILNPLLYA